MSGIGIPDVLNDSAIYIRGHGRGCGHGHNCSGTNSASNKGLCDDLINKVSNYVHKSAAGQMRTTWEKLVQHVGTKYGQTVVNITAPVHKP